ncbi:Transcription factor [Arachis hypogaea]|nr:Transcription factor [Arachis hypogaea]
MQCEGEADERRKRAFQLMASDGARPQVRRPDRVAPPPSRALNHRRYQNQNHSRQLLFRFRLRTRQCWLSLFSFLNSPSSTSAASSLDHKPLLAPTPFILGKRIHTDDDASAKDDGVSVGSLVGPGAPAGLWALPARPDFGQIWSFAAAAPPLEMVVQSAMVSVSHSNKLLCLFTIGISSSNKPWEKLRRRG